MKKTYQITEDGKRELEEELQYLIGQRAVIAQKIADARDFGDLSENAEYDSAREEQGLVETRIAEIEDILQNAEIITAGPSNGTVQVGHVVEVAVSGSKKTIKYHIVGSVEADPLEGKISDESPIGSALLGRRVGDKVSVDTPKGEMEYEIISVG